MIDLTNASATACTPSPTHALGERTAAALASTLKALADPLRLRMLSAIAADPRGEVCVCDLGELSKVSQPTVSHHLKKMKETGLLLSERRGTWVYYRIAPARRAAVAALLDVLAPAVTMDAPEGADDTADAFTTMKARVPRLPDDESAGSREGSARA